MKRHGTKVSLSIPSEMIEEIRAEAERIDRSVTWLFRMAWTIAKPTLKTYPGDESRMHRREAEQLLRREKLRQAVARARQWR